MVNASEIKRSLVALDESQDLLVEIEAGVPDQGPIPEYPQHHLAAVFPGWRRNTGENAAGGSAAREEELGWDLTPLISPASPPPAVFSPGWMDRGFGSERGEKTVAVVGEHLYRGRVVASFGD